MLRTNCKFAAITGALIALALAYQTAGAALSNALVNGSFAQRELDESLSGWTPSPRGFQVATRTEDGQALATITCDNPAAPCGLTQTVAIRPEWSKLLVRGYVRVNQMHKASDAPADAAARVDLSWNTKAAGRRTPAATQRWTDPTNGWVEVNQLLDVPTGKDQLIVTIEIFGAKGSVDARAFSVTGWVMTFDDEFDGTAIDTTRWTPTDGDHIVFSPGIQYFNPDHVIVAHGLARFHADNTPHGAYQFQSGEIRSADKFQQLYGFWEFRLKLPTTEGTWPAVYLLRWDDAWPPEIDLCESTGRDMKTVYETNHFADDYGRHGASSVNFPQGDLDRSQWHTYAICWEPGALAWYLDGVYKGTTRPPEGRISEVPMYIRFNLAVSGWGGDPSKTPWPTDMECDFARVYQRADLPLPVYAEPSQEVTLPNSTVQLNAISCNPMKGFAATWTLAEGPASATIQAPHALITKARFAKPGMYRFTLTVTKGVSTASRDVLVYVNPSLGHS
ncbi:MAG: family 16 glycosylhydrolase [Capsulimonadaceae bacterium]|nr:family 16 glycosylhydrolase [Capsulimonadaceae bacterium]